MASAHHGELLKTSVLLFISARYTGGMKRSEDLAERVAGTTLIFFLTLVVGFVLSFIFPHVYFVPASHSVMVLVLRVIGFALLIFGTSLVVFAQYYRKPLYLPNTDRVCFDFFVGPYKYFHHPTYLGLIVVLFGVAAVVNAMPIAIAAGIATILLHYTLIRQEERLLVGECGPAYIDYQQKHRR